MSLRRISGMRNASAGEFDTMPISAARDALHGRFSTVGIADAIALLAASHFPLKHRDLEAVLADDDAPPRLRYLAAHGLTQCERTAAQEILLNAATTEDPVVLSGVMRALGRIGDASALQAIEGVLSRAQGRTRQHAKFAQLLIVHRTGVAVKGDLQLQPAEPLDLVADDTRRVLIRAARPRNAAQCLVSLGTLPYGIEAAEQPMFEFECDRCRGMLLINRLCTGPQALSWLRQRSAIFGIGALRNDMSGEYSPAALALTTPEGSRVRIGIFLTNGTLLFAGDASADQEPAKWHVQAVRRLGAFPAYASGSFVPGTLLIDRAVSGTHVVQRGVPAEIDVGVRVA